MSGISKRVQANYKKFEAHKPYSIQEAIALIKGCANVKFKESVDVAVKLGIDAKKSDQNVRGAIVLPHGTGKVVRVAVFAQGDHAAKAQEAGADIVGMEDLAQTIKDGNIDFDVVIAMPDTMRIVGQLGQILGPKGLMPNPKVGTVATDVVQAVKNVKSGQARFRNDKNGIIHCSIGKVDFAENALQENLVALIDELKKARPSQAKGAYFKKLILSTTMGPGVVVDMASL